MIENAIEWIKTQGGKTIKSISGNNMTLFVDGDEDKVKISVRIPNGNIQKVNNKSLKRYLCTREKENHESYEPAVGEFIINNCPFWIGNKAVNDTGNDQILQPQSSSLPSNNIKEESKPFVFIIDEINRGEISKIFGELFFSIDPGYRGDKVRVKTQYQNMITDKNDPFYKGFYVPENVYIIGTMNDIDRSVESMDFAMRRRFAWKEIKANDNTGMLDSFGELKEEIVLKMNRMNNAIWDEETDEGIEGLSTAYHIGGAYFKKLELYLNDDESNLQEAFQQLWENHLRGVLFEYLRGSFNAADNLKKLEEVYYQEAYTNDRVERQ